METQNLKDRINIENAGRTWRAADSEGEYDIKVDHSFPITHDRPTSLVIDIDINGYRETLRTGLFLKEYRVKQTTDPNRTYVPEHIQRKVYVIIANFIKEFHENEDLKKRYRSEKVLREERNNRMLEMARE